MVRTRSRVVKIAFSLLVLLGAWLQLQQFSKIRQQSNWNRRTQSIAEEVQPTAAKHRPKGFATRSKAGFTTRSGAPRADVVKAGDFVFSEGWDSSPIVIESHKLVFFTVPKAG